MTQYPGVLEAEPVVSRSETAVVPPKRRLRRWLMAGAGLAVFAAAGWFGYDYWTVGRFTVSTDDAYVAADTVTIAPKVSGYLAEVIAQDNQAVKAGQVLAHIDDRDYRVALDQAKANVLASRAVIDSEQAALVTQNALIETAGGAVAVDRANATFAEQDSKRYADLAATGFGTVQNAQSSAAKIAAARAAIARDSGTLASMVRQLDVIKAQIAQAQAGLAHDQAAEHQAELNLSYTTIVAPVDGVVGNRTLRVGQFVQAGTQLMSVVPSDAAYVVANYKETQLTDVKRGQAVAIEIDMFPGRVFHGHVDSLAPASGQTFALLPPDNATGNFTKVVQRIPVRITLDPDSADSSVLRPGMSVEPSIDTKAARPVRTAQAR